MASRVAHRAAGLFLRLGPARPTPSSGLARHSPLLRASESVSTSSVQSTVASVCRSTGNVSTLATTSRTASGGLRRGSSSAAGPPPSDPGILSKACSILPGLALAGCVAQAGFAGADAIGTLMGVEGPSPISGVPVAILLGLAINNTLSPPKALLAPGLKLCTKAVLQAGIVCVGAKLSAVEVMKLGVVGLPVVMTSIGAGLGSILWINSRLGLPARLGALTAAGTSICGVTAITALAPAIQANQQEVAYAVANVVAFGLVGMLAYPMLAHHTLDSSEKVGLFLGTAIHDTSQVMGAGLTYAEMYQDEVALKVAAVTKLTRNLFLAAVIPGLTYMNAIGGGKAAGSVPFTTMFPPFIFAFLGMAALRSLGDATDGFGYCAQEEWKALTSTIGGTVSGQLLGTAMAAVGLSTNFGVFKGVGLKPFAVGLAGAAIVGATGFSMAVLLGDQVKYQS